MMISALRTISWITLLCILSACAAPPTPADGSAQARAANDCVANPGSRLVRKTPGSGDNVQCGSVTAGPNRIYSRDDLERTGQTDLARALRQVDPAVTGGGTR